jgi:uncharacterized membrane protein YfcA
MSFPIEIAVSFAVLSLGASFINGGLGYGYSSISTPLALLVYVNRVINPAWVLLEAMMNTTMMILSGRRNNTAVIRRNVWLMASIVPGVILGSLILNSAAPAWLKLAVYAVILPLILSQAAGFRRPLRQEKAASVPLGLGVGTLYAVTTISGPPMALFYNNQGLPQPEFKAAMAQVRVVESYATCISYYLLGLFTSTSVGLFGIIAPPVLLGLPLGMFVARRLPVETFRRICMSFDALIVGYGLTQSLINVAHVTVANAYSVFVGVVVLDLVLLVRFFRSLRFAETKRDRENAGKLR